MLGKFGLRASHTVEVLPFGEEASSPDDLLAVAAGKAVSGQVFSPFALHAWISCHISLRQPLHLGMSSHVAHCCTGSCCVGHKGPVCHGVPALGPVEAGVVPAAAHSVRVRAGGHAAPHAGVGAELVQPLQAAAVAFLLHTLLALQKVPAMVANFSAMAPTYLVPGETSHWMCGQWDIFSKSWI